MVLRVKYLFEPQLTEDGDSGDPNTDHVPDPENTQPVTSTETASPNQTVTETTKRFFLRDAPRSRNWFQIVEFPGQVLDVKATTFPFWGGSVTAMIINDNRVSVYGWMAAAILMHFRLNVTLTAKYLPETQLIGDVNSDGIVNILDLVLVSSHFGKADAPEADVNDDGKVNIQDLVLVAGVIGKDAAAPSLDAQFLTMLSAADVQKWLEEAKQLTLSDAISQRGIAVLERLLSALTPKETALLPNYPNPFNPETWIPYHLAEPADVTLSIYSVDGKLVRMLALGHQAAGVYESKSRAAYWDGRNAVGERVASGVYFYTLNAGDFAATGKMLIMK